MRSEAKNSSDLCIFLKKNCELWRTELNNHYYLALCSLLYLHSYYRLAETETHTKRQATQHGCLPCLLVDGDKEIQIVYGKEKNCTVPTFNKNLLLPARQARRTNQGKAPLICTLRVPKHLSFNSQQGPPLSSLSGLKCENNKRAADFCQFKSIWPLRQMMRFVRTLENRRRIQDKSSLYSLLYQCDKCLCTPCFITVTRRLCTPCFTTVTSSINQSLFGVWNSYNKALPAPAWLAY